MSQTGSMARRVLEAVTAVGALVLGVMLAVVFLGAAPARAGTLTSQIFGTTTAPRAGTSSTPPAPSTTVSPPASTVPATTVRSVPVSTAAPVTAVTATPDTAPRAVAPAAGYPTYTTAHPTTTAAPTTTTTIAPLGGSLPVSPATLPLRTTGGNAHVNGVFAVLSGIGFLVALLIVAARLFVTRRGGPDRRPAPSGDGQVGPGAQIPVSRSS